MEMGMGNICGDGLPRMLCEVVTSDGVFCVYVCVCVGERE